MAFHNAYEAELFSADRMKRVRQEVKQCRGSGQRSREARRSWVAAAMAFVALLPASMVLRAVASLNLVQ
jgi:hypothetical protein